MAEQQKFPKCPVCDKTMIAMYQFRKKKWVKVGCGCSECKEMVWLDEI